MHAHSISATSIKSAVFVLPKPTKERVVNVIITPRLDYCNALLYGPSVVNIARMQRIHNLAARLIEIERERGRERERERDRERDRRQKSATRDGLFIPRARLCTQLQSDG